MRRPSRVSIVSRVVTCERLLSLPLSLSAQGEYHNWDLLFWGFSVRPWQMEFSLLQGRRIDPSRQGDGGRRRPKGWGPRNQDEGDPEKEGGKWPQLGRTGAGLSTGVETHFLGCPVSERRMFTHMIEGCFEGQILLASFIPSGQLASIKTRWERSAQFFLLGDVLIAILQQHPVATEELV